MTDAGIEQDRVLGFAIRPLTRRRLENFKANKRGFWSLWIFLFLFVVSLFAEVIANDRPILIAYDGDFYTPFLVSYAETEFGGEFPTEADYTDLFVVELVEKKGWILWPPIRFSYDTNITDLGVPAPSPPTARNWLGTDDQSRDVVARMIYGFRISVAFGLILTFFSSLIGIAAGALQGYFGGLLDLIGQRLIEIWADAAIQLDGASRSGACRSVTGAQFRICESGAGAGCVGPQDNVPPRAAECNGRDPDLPAFHHVGCAGHPDVARFSRLRLTSGITVVGRIA